MKHTEIGLIPDDWEIKTLGKMLKIGHGRDYKKLKSGNVPVYGTGGYMTSVNDFLYDGETVCIGRKGTIDKPQYHSGKIWTVDTLFYTYDFKLLNPKFLFYKFCLIDWLSMNEASGVPSLAAKSIENIQIAIPTETEQTAIANVLSTVDVLISTTEKLIQKKKNIKQGAMQNLLTGKLRLPGFGPQTKSPTYKQTELGPIPEDWEVKSLGEISTIIMGQSPNSDCYNTQKGMVLIQGNADISNRKTICRFYTTHITKTARKGDVIFTVRAPVGNVAKATFDCCLGRGVCAIQRISDFLYYYLIFIEDSWSKTSTGSTFDSINSDTLASTLIIQPSSKEEQTAIANVLSSMDKEIETLNTRLEKYRNLKTAMMQQLLTGKIRLV